MSADTDTRNQDLPEGWEWKTLGDVGRYHNGRAFKTSEWADSGRPIIRIQNLTDSAKSFNYFRGSADERHVVRRDDTLVSWAATLGVFQWEGDEAVLNQHIFKVDSDLDVAFHRWAMRAVLGSLMAKTRGSGMVHITRGDFLRQRIPVPPLDEQRAIVAAIEDAFARIDAIEAELDAVERLAGSLERSLLRDALTGAILGNQRLSSDTGLPPGWQHAAIDEIADVSLGRQKSPEHATGEHMVSYIRAANLTWDGLDLADVKEMNFSPAEQSKYSLREGDVLVCEASGSATEVGKAVVWHGELPLACFQNHVIRLRPKDEVTSGYLHLAITESARLGRFVRAVSGIGITNLGLKRMREWKIAFPPIEQQSEVVDAWERSTAQRVSLLAAVTEGRSLVGQLRARTLHSAFTGNLDHRQRSEKAGGCVDE